MKSVSSSIWSDISPRARVRDIVLIFSLGVLLGGCLSAKYEPADVIDKQVHRGSEMLDFDETSSILVSGGWDGELALWPMPQGAPSKVWQGHEGPVHGLGFAGSWIVSVGLDGWIKIWDHEGELLGEQDAGVAVERAAVSSARVITGHRDGSVRVWTLPDLVLTTELDLHQGNVRAVALDPTSRRFASVGLDRQVYAWDESGSPRRLTPAPGMTRSLEFAPDGNTLFAGGWVNLFKWTLADERLTVLPTDHWGLISGIQYVESMNVLATISRINDSSVYLLEPATGATVKTFAPQKLCGGDVAMSPNGRFLAATGDDGAVRMWDLEVEGVTPPVVAAAGPNVEPGIHPRQAATW